jgi:hypothetical protein
MNIQTVIAAVAEVRAKASDGEVAHNAEDDLYRLVLRSISDGTCDDPAACAREALKTLDIDFARWCA